MVIIALTLTLNDPWFDLMRTGAKRFEGRRNLPRIAALLPGNVVRFRHHTDASRTPFCAEVLAVEHYPTFRDALLCRGVVPILPLSPQLTVNEACSVYERYVSLATQRTDGIVLIELQLQSE